MTVPVAIVQKPPVLLDLQASMERAVDALAEASGQGAKLVMFPEAYLPGYPSWIWRLKPGGDMALGNQIHAQLRANSIDMSRDGLAPLRQAASEHGVVVMIGFNEVDGAYSGTTLFNSLALIDADGTIVNHHRKLMPTNPERMVWGAGDGSGLRVVDTAVGRIGCLICWENYMPLARFALYAQNLDIYLAPTWDCGEVWLASMNHIAREGGCWVLSCATALHSRDVPAEFPGRAQLFAEEEWINPGDAVVIKPFGGVHAGPLHQQAEILYAQIDIEDARRARKSLDVCGHYGRPDIFQLQVDRSARVPLQFKT